MKKIMIMQMQKIVAGINISAKPDLFVLQVHEVRQ